LDEVARECGKTLTKASGRKRHFHDGPVPRRGVVSGGGALRGLLVRSSRTGVFERPACVEPECAVPDNPAHYQNGGHCSMGETQWLI
jgi:hypothetical protein